MDWFATHATSPSRPSAQSLLDPELTGYELLRRLISERHPFSDWALDEQGRIPEDLEGDVEFAVQCYQLSVFLSITESKYGPTVSEKIRANLLLLSGFDETTESRLLTLFKAFRAAGVIYNPKSDPLAINDPEVQFHMTVASAVMHDFDWPEERKLTLLMPLAECLHVGQFWAFELFTKELDATTGVVDRFGWSELPGPFERQLERQAGNPLFPAMARIVSLQQLFDARKEDLRHAFKFLQSYKELVREGLSFGGRMLPIKEIATFFRAAIELLETCSVLGPYFSPEARVLENASEAANQQILQVMKETRCEGIAGELPSSFCNQSVP